MSSSSSSSSSEDYPFSDHKLIPFFAEREESSPIFDFAFDGKNVYAGTGPDGKIIFSKDRYVWDTFYITGDINVKAIAILNGYLYAGTGPDGKVYRINLSDNTVTEFSALMSDVKGIEVFNGEVYVVAERIIYKYNVLTGNLDLNYEPYAPVSSSKVLGGNLFITMDNENVIHYDGNEWELLR
tara:strand:- start:14975 stop:15523 length:549 start_codon:yes stop_codon:yes gene_type:complete